MTRSVDRLLVQHWPAHSAHARKVLRRNYRWLRRRGVDVVVARIILDSTLRAGVCDRFDRDYPQAGAA